MQVLISLPGMDEIEALGGPEHSLLRKVCGVPLLARVIATASRSGATEFLLLHATLPDAWLKACLNSPPISAPPIEAVALGKPFDPDNPSDWQAIESRLESRFLWFPWNYIADKKALSRMIEVGTTSDEGVRFAWPGGSSELRREEQEGSAPVRPAMPAVVIKEKLKIAQNSADRRAGTGSTLQMYLADTSFGLVFMPRSPGLLVRSSQSARQAERELVRGSGKDTDGIFSKTNRWLCRPAVRWLSKTPVTPNMVSFFGLAVAIGSGYWYAQGYWSAYVLGALLYFGSVLIDEMDGMLARLTFQESAFGCWLETFVDYATYVLLFVGMSIGMYQEGGARWLALGGLLLFGTLTSFLVVSNQRKLATERDKPNEYLSRIHRRLEADSANLLSRFGRRTEFVMRKCAFGYWVFIFSVLGGLKIFFLLAAFGSNVVWPAALSFNRLFRRPSSGRQPTEDCQPFGCSQAEEGG